MRRKRGFLAVLAILGPVALLAGACSQDEKGRGDAPVGERHETPRQVWLSPDQFPNVVAYCIGDNGAYLTTREAPPVILPNDPNCKEGGVLAE